MNEGNRRNHRGLVVLSLLLAALCAARYEDRGYFAMLPDGRGGRDLTALHRRFEELRRRPYAPGPSREEIDGFVRALLDVRFRVRLQTERSAATPLQFPMTNLRGCF